MDHKVSPWVALTQECTHSEVVGVPTWVVECAVEEVAVRWDPEDQVVDLGTDPMDLTWVTAGKVVVVVVAVAAAAAVVAAVVAAAVVEVNCGRLPLSYLHVYYNKRSIGNLRSILRKKKEVLFD
jgi:hypothetical protein